MSLLVILLPPRERLGARGTGPESASSLRLPTETRAYVPKLLAM